MTNLGVIGDRAASEVYALMDHSTVSAENDGSGIYLLVEVTESEWLITGCPTLAAEDEHAKWYVSSGAGDWHVDSSFDHQAKPEEVKQWILEQVEAYKARTV